MLRACKISERGGIWKRMAEIILVPRLNEQSATYYPKVFREATQWFGALGYRQCIRAKARAILND